MATRKKKATQETQAGDPKAFLMAVMNDPNWEPEARLDAAADLLPYFHERLAADDEDEDDDDDDDKASIDLYDDAPQVSAQRLRVAAVAALLPYYYAKRGEADD